MSIENIYCVSCREKMVLVGVESNFHLDSIDESERQYYFCDNCNIEICLEIK